MITFGLAGLGVNRESLAGTSGGGVRSESCRSGGAGVDKRLSSSDGSCDATETLDDGATSSRAR